MSMLYCRECGSKLDEWKCTSCGLDQRIFDAVPITPYQNCECGHEIEHDRMYCQRCGKLLEVNVERRAQRRRELYEKEKVELDALLNPKWYDRLEYNVCAWFNASVPMVGSKISVFRMKRIQKNRKRREALATMMTLPIKYGPDYSSLRHLIKVEPLNKEQ